MNPYRLLIVDDDPELRNFLVTELSVEGYNCQEAATGQQALGQIRSESWDLVLLDWTLPDFNGVEVCRRMRQGGISTPVLMITARDEVRERVEALDSGADDYLTKPFSIEELLARVRARLRRTGLNDPEDGLLRIGDLVVNPASHDTILDTLWGEDWTGDDNLLDVYVRYLRKKMERPGQSTLIQTVRGVGFMVKEGPPR
ncbi:MAG: response regulator transcription factor [Cyanobacteria bacterium]|nr:response regulator transcription factor [Cyanobacteriota bacterium]